MMATKRYAEVRHNAIDGGAPHTATGKEEERKTAAAAERRV
jgi:hypothetical protein